MLVAVCPHPPLLLPALDPHQLAELAPVRSAARAVVAQLLAAARGTVTVLGSEPAELDETAGGSLHGWGVDARVGGAGPQLPPDALVGAWLLDDAGWTGPRHYVGPDADLSTADVLLVMADGTATRTERAPGHLDPRAQGFDDGVADALAGGDADRLAHLDLRLADVLGCRGGPALRHLGAVVAARVQDGATVTGTLHHHSAPFGVGYWVARWDVARASSAP